MSTAILRKVGGSVMLAVPRPVLDLLDLQAGAEVDISVADGKLIVEPGRRPRYTLDELLSQCDPDTEMSSEDREWFDGGAQGAELI